MFFCPKVRMAWFGSSLSYKATEIDFQSFSQWWMKIVTMLNTNNMKHELQFIALLYWQIWKHRNAQVFQFINYDPLAVVTKAQQQRLELLSVHTQRYPAPPITSSPIDRPPPTTNSPLDWWQLPRKGRLKLNCDAAFNLHKNEAQIAVICRDYNGAIIFVSSKQVKCNSPGVAEALALQEAFIFMK